jgi:hypothetical protein
VLLLLSLDPLAELLVVSRPPRSFPHPHPLLPPIRLPDPASLTIAKRQNIVATTGTRKIANITVRPPTCGLVLTSPSSARFLYGLFPSPSRVLIGSASVSRTPFGRRSRTAYRLVVLYTVIRP